MLYDNALLLRFYTDAFRAFGADADAATASDIGTYLLREMQSPKGGFYSAQDADSEGEEGKFFVWTEEEVESALAGDPVASEVARRYFGVTKEGNFEGSGATVRAKPPAFRGGIGDGQAGRGGRRRPHPRDREDADGARETREALRDEKVLELERLTIGAPRTPRSPSANLRRLRGHKRRPPREGPASEGRVARLAKARRGEGSRVPTTTRSSAPPRSISRATGNERYLASARLIADQLILLFWDPAGGGFFFTPNDGEKLITRSKDPFDQATPSGGSIAGLVLLKLSAIADEKYGESARRHLESLAPAAVDNPFAFGQTLGVLDRLVRGSTDVVILGKKDDSVAKALHRAAFQRTANRISSGPTRPSVVDGSGSAPHGRRRRATGGAYAGRGRTCSAPVRSADDLPRFAAVARSVTVVVRRCCVVVGTAALPKPVHVPLLRDRRAPGPGADRCCRCSGWPIHTSRRSIRWRTNAQQTPARAVASIVAIDAVAIGTETADRHADRGCAARTQQNCAPPSRTFRIERMQMPESADRRRPRPRCHRRRPRRRRPQSRRHHPPRAAAAVGLAPAVPDPAVPAVPPDPPGAPPLPVVPPVPPDPDLPPVVPVPPDVPPEPVDLPPLPPAPP
jgi:hypothetical protein